MTMTSDEQVKAAAALRERPRYGMQGTGSVVDLIDGRAQVSCTDGLRSCRIAAGCLLQPLPLDRVAWFQGEDGIAYVLSVLERAAQAPAEIRLPADSRLHAPVRLSLCSGESLTISANRIEWLADSLKVAGRAADIALGTINAFGDALTMMFDRVFGRSRIHHRTVDGPDIVNAQTIAYKADSLALMDAENVAINGQRLVKLRGGQIHMG